MKTIFIEMKGKKYSCRPTFETIEAIENATGKGTMQLVRELLNSQYKMSELVVIVSCMIGKNDKELTVEQVSNEVIGNVKTYSVPVLQYLMECNQGSEELATDDNGGSEGKV